MKCKFQFRQKSLHWISKETKWSFHWKAQKFSAEIWLKLFCICIKEFSSRDARKFRIPQEHHRMGYMHIVKYWQKPRSHFLPLTNNPCTDEASGRAVQLAQYSLHIKHRKTHPFNFAASKIRVERDQAFFTQAHIACGWGAKHHRVVELFTTFRVNFNIYIEEKQQVSI